MNQSRALTVVSHLTGWILFLSLIIGFVSTSSTTSDVFDQLTSSYFLLFVFVYAFLFYLNTSILIPRLYLAKRYFYYFTIIAGLMAAVYFISPFDQLLSNSRRSPNAPPQLEMRPPAEGPHGPGPPGMSRKFEPGEPRHRKPGSDIVSIILFVMVLSLSSALVILKQWRITEQRVARAEAEKANAELSFLKAQINPHFLFNTLNNIYSMAVTKDANTPDSIMKLSHIMRYVTDEVAQQLVPLQSEMDCASDYIALQQLRLSKKVNLEFSVTGNAEGKQVPPLILMPFIENVFKYGISSHEPSTITISIASEKNSIIFFCQNRIFNHKKNGQRTGIGIANTKKRLEHHYQDKHALTITNADGLYTVQLILPA